MTGFSDAKYFREVFKKHYNVSPSGKEKKKAKKSEEEKRKNVIWNLFKIGAFLLPLRGYAMVRKRN